MLVVLNHKVIDLVLDLRYNSVVRYLQTRFQRESMITGQYTDRFFCEAEMEW
jgi:hypothetical protein